MMKQYKVAIMAFVGGGLIIGLSAPVWAVSNNGFETDWIYATNRAARSCPPVVGSIAAFDDTTIFEHLRQLASAEGGVIYFDESGILRFENREHLAGHTTSVVTIDQDNAVEDTTDETDEGALVNGVAVVVEALCRLMPQDGNR